MKFACPFCQNNIDVPPHWAGHTIKCPHVGCGNQIVVPGHSKPLSLHKPRTHSKPTPTARPSWKNRKPARETDHLPDRYQPIVAVITSTFLISFILQLVCIRVFVFFGDLEKDYLEKNFIRDIDKAICFVGQTFFGLLIAGIAYGSWGGLVAYVLYSLPSFIELYQQIGSQEFWKLTLAWLIFIPLIVFFIGVAGGGREYLTVTTYSGGRIVRSDTNDVTEYISCGSFLRLALICYVTRVIYKA